MVGPPECGSDGESAGYIYEGRCQSAPGTRGPGRMRIGVADPQEFWAPGRAQLQVIEIWESKEQYDRVAGSEIAHG